MSSRQRLGIGQAAPGRRDSPDQSRTPTRPRPHTRRLGGVLLLLAACGVPSAAPPLEPADFVLAGIPLYADSAEIRLSFGEPDSVVTSQHPYDAHALLVAWHYDGLVVRYSGEPLPSSYLLTGGDEATARGVRVGDAASLLLERYGEPTFRNERIWTYTELDDAAEMYVLEFLVVADTVARIHVGRAED